MRDITGCKAFPMEDVINWDQNAWTVNGSQGYSDLRYLDLQKEICPVQKCSHFFIPYLMNREPAGAHMCRKFSEPTHVALMTMGSQSTLATSHPPSSLVLILTVGFGSTGTEMIHKQRAKYQQTQ